MHDEPATARARFRVVSWTALPHSTEQKLGCTRLTTRLRLGSVTAIRALMMQSMRLV